LNKFDIKRNKCARLECGRSWVRAQVGVKPNTIKIVFVASLLKTEHYAVKAKTGNWLRIKIMCPR